MKKRKKTSSGRRGVWRTQPVIARPFVPHEFHQRVQFLKIPESAPKPIVVISPQAYADMFMLVDIMDIEVGWLASVFRKDYVFYVEEIFVTEQTANGGTCNLHTDGQAKLFQELFIQRSDGIDVVNRIRFWGHSHHSMSTTATTQDEDQMMELAEGCGDYFIRAILTKHGEIKITLILYDENYRIEDVPWRTVGVAPIDDAVRRAFWENLTKERVVLEKYEPEVYYGYGYEEYFDFSGRFGSELPGVKTIFPALSCRESEE